MDVCALGYRTDLMLIGFDGDVLDRGNYVVARSPANPTFYWGNFLLFDHVPDAGEVGDWRDLFRREFEALPELRHFTFGMMAPETQLAGLSQSPVADFEVSRAVVLTIQRPCATGDPAHGAEVRPLTTDQEWEQAIENQVQCREPGHELEGYRTFKRRQMARNRRMVESGWGSWFGAFIGERLVGDLGLFAREGLARFQSVGVHPEFRRRGICRSMLFQASTYGFEQLAAEELVIVAERDYHALALYRSAGFTERESQVGLCSWPRAGD